MSNPSDSPAAGAQRTRSPATLASFRVAPYRPDGGFTLSGFAMLTSAMLIVGGILGYVVHWVSQYFYLILLFPILMGFLLGAVGVRTVRFGRIRNPWIGGIAGFIGAVVAMFMMHHFDYEMFNRDVEPLRAQYQALADLSPQERAELIAAQETAEAREAVAELIELMSVRTFWDYLDFAARQGVVISSSGGSDRGTNLGYTGTWIYWIVELLIVAGFSFAMVRSSAAEPFCTSCGQWKSSRVFGFLAGEPNGAQQALASGDLKSLHAAGCTPEPTPLRLTMAHCTHCAQDSSLDLKLEQLTVSKDNQTEARQIGHVTYPGDALAPLEQLFAPAK